MYFKMRILNKIFGTLGTLVWPFASMRAKVNLQIVAPKERTWTVWTL